MSKKSVRGLIVVGSLALILALVFLLLTLLPRLKNSDADINLSMVGLSDIATLTLDCGNDICTFENRDGTWVYTEREDYPVGQNRLTRLASVLSSLTAEQSFAPESELSAYGLDLPSHTITASASDGSSLTLWIGKACGDSSYYAMIEGSNQVSVIGNTLEGYLGYTLLQMLDAGSTPCAVEDEQVSLLISRDGLTARFTQEDGHWYYESADGAITKEDELPAVNSSGDSTTLRGVLNDLGDSLSSYKTSLLAGYNMTDAELNAMGLNNPLTVTFTDTSGNEIIYLFGETTINDAGVVCRYLMVPDSPAVYVAEQAEVLFTLWEQFAY